MESKSLINPYATPQICDAVYKKTVHKEQICKYDKGFANSLAQGFLSDVYKKNSTRAKKLQA